MTRRRPMVVAFEQALTAHDRLFLDLFGKGVSDEHRRRPPGKGKFWCAADKPEHENSVDFVLRPVYRTTKLPTDEYGHPVRCEECGIEIARLQEMFTSL